MADSLKSFFSPALVRRIAESIAAVHPEFPRRPFVKDATRGLDELELLARGRQIAGALHRHLPDRYEDAVEVLVRSLGPRHASDELEGVGMAPFFYLPHTIFVATHGLGPEHFEISMRAQHVLTQRFTCELSIRPFLEHHRDRTLAILREWTSDPSPHVRRLVSEGTRPRLPWAPRVSWIEREPERVLPLLEALKDDPTTLVRRSVANHLNDLSKSHPKMVAEIAQRWLSEKNSSERRALVKHALRSAIKRGDPSALATLGFGRAPEIAISNIAFVPRRVAIGKNVRIAFSILSKKKRGKQSLAVDLIVHFVKKNGNASAKVFKVGVAELNANEAVTFAKVISLAVHTTRKPNPGRHRIEAAINGQRFDLGAFIVTGATGR